jgi:predicted membrane protein
MKNTKKIIWGLLLIVLAALLALNSLGVIEFELFFDGWWTLFIIVPSLAALIENKNKTDSIISLLIGIIFLLCARDILSWDMVWKLALPVILASMGIKIIISAFRKKKSHRIVKEIKVDGEDLQKGIAVFSGTELNFDNAVFDGADLVACFGGVECDLRHAIIDKDCIIHACCVFGGIDIKVPDNVKVVNNASSIFGGIDVIKSNNSATHTIYIDGICVFGGIDIQ